MIGNQKTKLVKEESVTICEMTKEMLEEVSRVHLQTFKGAMNTRLGTWYIRKFLEGFVRDGEGIALVAILKTENKERIIGYAIGIPPHKGKSLDRALFWVASWSACMRPWLFFDPLIRAAVKTRITSLLGSTVNIASLNLVDPVMSLVGLAVLPKFQDRKIGGDLLCAFEKYARKFKTSSLKLSVYPDNMAARRVYERNGWLPWEPSIMPGKAMFYYKLL